MIARKQEINLQLYQFTDAILLGLAFWLSHALRYNQFIILDNLRAIESFDRFIWILAVIMPVGPFLLEIQGFYAYPLEKSLRRSVRQIVSAAIWLTLILGLAVIFLRLDVPSRSVLLIFAVLGPSALLIRERMVAWNDLRRLQRGEFAEHVIVAGEKVALDRLLASLTPMLKMEIRVAEEVDLTQRSVDDLVEAIHKHSVGRVILAFDRMDMDMVQRAIEACEAEGIEAWLSADFVRTSVARPTYERLGRRPMLVFRATPEVSWELLVKGLIDRIGAFIGLVLLSPVFLGIAVLVKLTSPGPAFFKQKRAGLYGRPFEMWKFRTMYVDAEQRRAELESRNVMRGPVFKVDRDPRITKVGHWLRKTSVDEFPQLINVLRGEMSLVGPRPLPLYEVEKFERRQHRRRLSMKPGLTCIWQIRGRNTVTDFNDWVRMDLEYIDNWSILLDFYILVRTVPSVLLGIGAK